MLVSFEGQDGAGKTTLLLAVYDALTSRGIPSGVIEEFSDGPYGARLAEAVIRDKFLRPTPGEPATYLSRALEVAADLYYQDEKEIGQALQMGHVVLKDRHVDTLLYTLTPTLIDTGAIKDERQALTWLKALCSQLRYRPDLTIYVDAPLDIRIARIQARQRHLQEARANETSAADIEVFRARERVARHLIDADPARFVVLDNARNIVAEGAATITQAIISRRDTATRKGER